MQLKEKIKESQKRTHNISQNKKLKIEILKKKKIIVNKRDS